MLIHILFHFPAEVDVFSQVARDIIFDANVRSLLEVKRIAEDMVIPDARMRPTSIIVFNDSYELMQKQYFGKGDTNGKDTH